MSAETRTALEEALQAHVADELSDEPTLLTDFLILTSSQTLRENTSRYFYTAAESSAMHSSLGLLDLFRQLLHEEVRTG